MNNIAEKDIRTTEIWNELNIYQTDFCLPQELCSYYSSPAWLAANSVLDIGTGNGYYLNKLSNNFPDKKYHGIDHVANYISLANKNYSSQNLLFHVDSLEAVKGSFDFVIMRLLLQHLTDPESSLDRVAEITKPGAYCFIIDSIDQSRFFYPKLPEFTDFFRRFIDETSQQGLDRNIANNLALSLDNNDNWQLVSNEKITIPSTWPGNMELFTKTYNLVLDLVSVREMFPYDFDAVKRAWSLWVKNKQAYTQVGLRVLLLQRI